MTRILMQDVRKATGAYYGLRRTVLTSRNRARKVAYPRQLAIMACRDLTGASLPEIASHFGLEDHSTLIHGVDAVQARLRANEDEAMAYWTIERVARLVAAERHARDTAQVQNLLEARAIIPAPILEPAE